MLRKVLVFILLVFLAVLLQLDFFSAWNFGGVSPQILVIFGYFAFRRLKPDFLWWFLLLYFVFYGGLAGFGPAGFYLLAFVLFFNFLYFIDARFLRLTGLSSLTYLVLISLAAGIIILGQRQPNLWLTSILVSFAFYLIFYPFFYAMKRLAEPSAAAQLSLKI